MGMVFVYLSMLPTSKEQGRGNSGPNGENGEARWWVYGLAKLSVEALPRVCCTGV